MSDILSPKFKENVYSTVCYGCGFGCGVYVRELQTLAAETKNECGAPILNIDYRKPSPVNEGKLCRFGVNLTKTYCPAVSKVNGKAADNSEAVSQAADILKKADPSKTAFLSIGGTTNEEHLAFMKLGEKLSIPVSTGMTGIFKDIGKLHAYTGRGTTYDDVASAKKIYLFVDPYVQYPLLVRRLIHAKNKGAEIISFGLKELPIAAQNVFVAPETSLYDVKEFTPDDETLIISDLTPYTYSRRLAEIIEVAGGKSKFLFMRPFMNAAGAGYLSKHTVQQSFDDIVSKMETGDLKVLVCLDSDLSDICFNDSIKEAFKNLDSLIVLASRATSVCEIADIVIATEPFYKKKGSVMSVEGRLIQISTDGGETLLTGFNALSDLLTAVGGSALDFDVLRAEAVSALGVTEDEFKVTVPERKKSPEIKKISDRLPELSAIEGAALPESYISDSAKETEGAVEAKHVYIPTPFLWNGISDENNYVELSRSQVKESALMKGFTADITCACGEVKKTSRFKVSSMMDGYLISMRKQPFAKGPVVSVTVQRSPTKPKELETNECKIPQ
jgi:Anaerobic dehydrogenases, typically selenocysteine-containing